MFKRIINPFFYKLNDLIQDTRKVFLGCILILFFSLVVDGTIYRLWKLNHQYTQFKTDLVEVKLKNIQTQKNIEKANDPDFIKQMALERLDLAEKGDLIFVFSK